MRGDEVYLVFWHLSFVFVASPSVRECAEEKKKKNSARQSERKGKGLES
jgi:hypothetical protein